MSRRIHGFDVALAGELPGGDDASPHAETHGIGGPDFVSPASIGAAEEEHTHELADITDAGDAAGLDVGTSAGTVAAGDHNHTGVYQPADPQLDALADMVIDTDGALAANSDSRLATQKAVKTAIATAVTGLLEFMGATDCSANPNYPAASKGDSYLVSVAGKIGGASGKDVGLGDLYVATADNAGGTEASVGTSWTVLEHNFTAAQLLAMLVTVDGTGSGLDADTVDGQHAAALTPPSPGYVSGRVYTALPALTVTTLAWPAADRLYMLPIVIHKTVTITALGVYVTTSAASTTARLGLYRMENGVPTTLIVDGGTVATTSTGAREVSVSQSLEPGVYAIACTIDSTSVHVQAVDISAAGNRYYADAGVNDAATANRVCTFKASTPAGSSLPNPAGAQTAVNGAATLPRLYLKT